MVFLGRRIKMKPADGSGQLGRYQLYKREKAERKDSAGFSPPRIRSHTWSVEIGETAARFRPAASEDSSGLYSSRRNHRQTKSGFHRASSTTANSSPSQNA